jgi:hypothetical protein
MEAFLNKYRSEVPVHKYRNRKQPISPEEAVKLYIRSQTEHTNYEPEHRSFGVSNVIDYVEVMYREMNVGLENYPHSKNVFRQRIIDYLMKHPNDFRRVLINNGAIYEPNFV